MSRENVDHRHRNIAAIVEYLTEGDVIVANVTTPDDYDDELVSFELVVPPFGPHELRADEVDDE
jgi:hypothetical protein